MSRSNEERIAAAAVCLATVNGPDEFSADPRSCVIDLLANLMHFGHDEKIDFNECLSIAQDHYREEREPT